MNDREVKLLRSMDMSGSGFRAWVLLLGAVILLGAFAYARQFRYGLVETGMRDQISWGLYISNFVFFIGISHAGTLISAILRVTDADWRRPITRMAEGITVVALCIGGSMVLIDLGRPDRALNLFRFGRIQSPIVWDVLSVSTYLTGCLIYFYLPLIPDLAIVAGTSGSQSFIGGFRRSIYRALSLGWTGTQAEWHLLEKAISTMAVMIIPLAISVHTVVSWIFAMTLRPGWDSSIFGPYFVVGAIYSGAAAVVLAMCLLRHILHLEDYLEPLHYRNLGLLLLSFSLLYLYFNVNEYLTVGYKFQGGEKLLLERLFFGDYAAYFWAVQAVGVVFPMLLMIAVLGPQRYRQFTVPGLGLASFLAIIGAWAKRYLIVVPTLSSPFLPIQGVPEKWGHYTPTWVEWAITAAAFAAFLLLYTLLVKVFPVISVWETRPAEVPAADPPPAIAPAFGPAAWGAAAKVPVILLCLLLAAAVPARADKPEPTSITVTWASLPPSEVPEVEDARTLPPAGEMPERLMAFGGAMPHFWNSPANSAHRKEMYPAVGVSARLRDARGQALSFQPVAFLLKTSLGALDFGARPTDDEGAVQLVVRDRRYGRYPVSVIYHGDDGHQASRSETVVDFGPRPAPALPEAGVLISPTFSPAIGLPFLAFYGSMWCVFAYAVGYLIIVRMRRARHQSPSHQT
jgi:molybdopterin-containing oxidoreductase family membrane subunit